MRAFSISALAEGKLSETLAHWERRATLLNGGTPNWKLGRDYAFSLMFERLQSMGVALPTVSAGLVLAFVLAVMATLLAGSMLLGLMPFTRMINTLTWLPILAFLILNARILNIFGLPRSWWNGLGAAIGIALISLSFFGSDTNQIATLGSLTTLAVAALCLAACLAALCAPTFHKRYALLDTLMSPRQVKDGLAIMLSALNVANAVKSLREANEISAEQYQRVRELYGAVPGHRAYGLHPLEMTDRRFEADLQQLLTGKLPSAGGAVS